jgi:hypothetical protein
VLGSGWNLRIKEGETDCFEWVQPKLGRIVPPKVGINALYHQPVRTAASTVIPKFDPVWSNYSNGLKWRGLGFSPSSLLEWTSPIQKQRLQSYLSRSLRLRGNPRCSGRRLLAYVTGTVNQELLLRNEYLAAENRILRGQIKGRLLVSEGEKATLAEIGHRLGRRALQNVAATAKPDTILGWYRKLVANKSDGSKFRRSVGRPKVDEETERLVMQMARENPS